jgi:hypothetical protein
MTEWRFTLHDFGVTAEATIKTVAQGKFQLTYNITDVKGPRSQVERDMQGRDTFKEAEKIFIDAMVTHGVPLEAIVFSRQPD